MTGARLPWSVGVSTTSPACSACGRLDYPHVCASALGAIPTVATGVVQCRVVYRVFIESVDNWLRPVRRP